MSSPTPHAQRLKPPHSWRGTATRLITLAFRLAIIIVAIWSVQFTIERQHAWVFVEDYHHCAPVMGDHGLGFPSGCAYNDVSVSPSLLHQTYQITAPDGSTIRTRKAEPGVTNATIGDERKTPTTWLLYEFVAFALAPSLCMSLFRRVGLRVPDNIKIGPRRHLALIAFSVCAGTLFFAPTLRETLVLHRIEANESDSRDTDVEAFATAVRTSDNGDLFLLGTNDYDLEARSEGFGCRLYSAAGRPISREAFASPGPLKETALPPRTRFVGQCLFPQYVPAHGR